jgi:hypothetical protein
MAYADHVLSKSPTTYLTLSGSDGNLNIGGRGTGVTALSGYTAGVYPQIVPGYECSTISSGSIDNPMGYFTEASRQKSYTIELWAKLKVNPFSGYYTTPYDIIGTSDGYTKVYIENSFVTFMITDSEGTVYRARVKHADFDESMHVVAVYSTSNFYIVVNGVQSEDVQIFPSDKTIKSSSATITIDSTNMFLSNLAMYSRPLAINEIQSNYSVGKNKLDKAVMVRLQGGSFYTLSKSKSSVRYSNKINYQDFSYGNTRNLVVDSDKLKCIDYASLSVQDSEAFEIIPQYLSTTGIYVGSMSVTGSLSSLTGGYITVTATGNNLTTGSTVILSSFTPSSFNEEVVVKSRTANQFTYASTNTSAITGATGLVQCVAHAHLSAVPGLSNNNGFIGISLIPNSSIKELLTVYSRTSSKSLTWSLTGTTGLIQLISTSYDSAGATASTTSYNYASPIALGSASDMWVLFNPSGIRLSTNGSTFNQSSASDYVPETVVFDTKTEVIVGASYDYKTTSTSKFPISKIWIGDQIVNDVTLSNLKLTSYNNYYYNLSATGPDLSAKTAGEWTQTFPIATEGPYNGTYIDFDISPDSLSKVQIKYNGEASYSECFPGKFIPSMPYSGTLGSTGITLTLQALLETSNTEKNIPEFSSADIFIYQDALLGGDENLGEAVITGSNVSIRPSNFAPGENRKRLNTTFINNSYVAVPAATGGTLAHQSIEFTFAYQGTPNNGSVICSSSNGLNKISISNAGLVTVSGWPTGTSYLNGSVIASGATAHSDSINHILIVGSTGTTGPLYLNASVTGSTASSYFSSATGYLGATAGVQTSYGYLATWPIALDGATGGTAQTGQTKDALASRRGLVIAQLNTTGNEQITISSPTGATGPEVKINVTPWQGVSSS